MQTLLKILDDQPRGQQTTLLKSLLYPPYPIRWNQFIQKYISGGIIHLNEQFFSRLKSALNLFLPFYFSNWARLLRKVSLCPLCFSFLESSLNSEVLNFLAIYWLWPHRFLKAKKGGEKKAKQTKTPQSEFLNPKAATIPLSPTTKWSLDCPDYKSCS